MKEIILVVNAGSSTIKWKIFDLNFKIIANGMVDRIGIHGVVVLEFGSKKINFTKKIKDHYEASSEILKLLEKEQVIQNFLDIKYIGFRVVQGGSIYEQSILLDEQEIQKIDALKVLAPLHNGPAVQTIRAFQNIIPHAKMSATFDTSFHITIPKINSIYPIKKELYDKYKIKKYGMHGISHKFITNVLKKTLNKDSVTFINAHIGNGSSLCAIKNSQSYDTSMGLTPLAGVMMGTRSGDIDPSIHKFIMENANMSIQEVDNMLNKESGMKGVSGVSSDLRDVYVAEEKGNQQAKFALDLYAQKIADFIAKYHNKLEAKTEAIVFTAGIGENAAKMRQSIVDKLFFANIELDKKLNSKITNDVQIISKSTSAIPIYVIRTNEELMIAQDIMKLTQKERI